MPHPLDGSYESHGTTFKVSVSPCSWMHKGYGFQFQFSAHEGRSWGLILDKSRAEATATRDDVQAMLDGLPSPAPCPVCKNVFVADQAPDTGKAYTHLCEKCRIVKLEAEWDQESAKERDREARKDKSMKRKGFRFKTIAWVHAGGDDYALVMYSKLKPTDEEIKAELKKKRSRVLNDYSTVEL